LEKIGFSDHFWSK
jgi:hypothetical protein